MQPTTSPLGIREGERTAVFIDGPSLYAAAKQTTFDIDYRHFRDHFADNSELMRIYYYTPLLENPEDDYSPLRPLLDYLDYNGFSLITKPMKEFVDGDGRRRHKGDVGIEMAVDMIHFAYEKLVDHIVLFSGDGSFRRAVEAVQAKGVRVTVVSTLKVDTPMIADELRRQADDFVDLTKLAGIFARAPKPLAPAR
jgi:uncharacterized LabA/DUF88 family protein